MKGKFDAIKYAKSLEKQLSADPARKKKIQDALAQLQKRVAEEEKKGADLTKVNELLSDAGKAVEKNDYPRAEELIAGCEEGLRGLQESSVEEELAVARDFVEDVELLGVDIARALDLIDQAEAALKARDAKAARKFALNAKKEAEKARETTVSDVVSYAEGLVSESETMGMEVSEFKATLDKVRELMLKGDFNTAINLTSSLTEDMETHRRNHFRDFTSNVQTALEEAKQAGLDTSRLETSFSRARSLIDSKDYETAAELLKQIEEETRSERALLSEAGESSQALSQLISSVEARGLDAGDLKQGLARIERLRASRELPAARSAAVELQKSAEALLSLSAEASKLMEQTRAAISGGAKMGMDVKTLTQKMGELDGQLKERKFKEVSASARKILDKVQEWQKELSASAITSLESELARFRKAGASVAEPEAVLKKARSALEEGRYEEAFSLARRTVDEVDALRDALARYNEELARCEELAAGAREQGLDCKAAEPLVQGAKEAASRGEFLQAAENVGKALELLGAMMPGGTGEGIQYALGLVERADEEGAQFENIEKQVLEGLGFAERRDFRSTQEAAEAVEKSVAAQTRAYHLAADAVQNAQETVAEAMMEELDISPERRKLEEARAACEKGEYESARYQAEDIAPALRLRCREALDRKLQLASGMVEEFGQSGAEIPRAREYLRRARELSECGRFGLGHSYAARAVDEAKLVGDRFREAQDARSLLESMLDSARELGVPAGELDSLLAAVNSFMDRREYEQAVQASAEGIEKAERGFAETARSLGDACSRILTSLHSLPVDTAAEREALRKAQERIKREEWPEAIGILRPPLETLDAKKRLYEDATGALQAAGKRLDEAEAYGLPSDPVKEKLAEAMRAYSSGAYGESVALSRSAAELAEGLISERAAQEMEELRALMEETEQHGTVLEDLRERVGALSGSFSSKAFTTLFKEAAAVRSEIERRKSKHAEALEGLSRIQASIEEIKGMGADVSPTEDLLGLARFAAERGAYEDVLDYSHRAEAELLNAAEGALRNLRGKLTRRIEELGKDGVELSAAVKALSENTALAEGRQFRAALTDLQRVETDIEVRRDQFRNTQKVLATAEARLTEAGGLGVSTTEAAKLLSSARKAAAAGDYPKAVELAEQSRDTVARNIESHQQTIGAIELARAHAREAESMGADIARAQELLEQSAAALAGRNYDEAMGKVVECEQELVHSQETLVNDTAGLARATLDDAAKIGADINQAKEMLARAESAMQAREFDSAFALARESYESAQQSRERHSAALGRLSEIQKLVQNAHSEGVRVMTIMGELEDAREALQRYDYDSCNAIANRCRVQAEELIAAASLARRDMERCEQAFHSAQEIKASLGDSEALFAKANEEFQAGEYPAAREHAGACFDQLAAAQHQLVWGELGQVLLEVEEWKDERMEVSAAAEMVEEAGVALAAGEFRDAQLRTRAGRARLVEARHHLEGIHNVLLTSSLIVEEARFLEADVVVASDLTAGAAEAFLSRNYQGAQELALQAAEEATRSQRSLITQLIATAEKAVTEAESWGIRSRVSRDRLARAKAAVEFQDFKGARDLLEECDDCLAQAISDHKAASEMMTAMTDSIVRGEGLGLDLGRIREGAARAEALVARGEYSRGMEVYNGVGRELAAAENEHVCARLAAVKKVLEECRAQGMDVGEEEEALGQVGRVLAAGEFVNAFELALKTSRELEANRKEFKRVGALVAELEEELRQARVLEVEVPAALGALAGAQAKLAKGTFASSEEEIKKGRVALAAVLAEAMSDRLVRLEDALRESEIQGVKAPRAYELFKEADRLYRSKDYIEMLKRIELSRKELEGSRKAREDIQRGLEEIAQRLKGMEALGADSSRPSGLVGRAMEVSSEGNYQAALSLLDEARAAVESAERARVEDFLKGASGVIDEGDAIGADTKLARKTQSDAKKALEDKDYRLTAELARAALEEAEKRVGEHRRHLELAANVEKMLTEAESSGLNMDRARRALEEARRSLRKYDYPAVVAGLERIHKDAEVLLRQSSEARRLISFCEKKIDAARKIGAEVATAESLLTEAKAATEKRIFVKAFDLATRCLKDLDSMQHAVVLGFLTDSETHLAEIEESGADTTEASDLIEVALEALNENEFEKAMELGRQALEMARGKIAQHEASSESLMELERKMKDASELGGDVRNIEKILERGRRALATHNHEKLAELAGEAMEALNGALQNLVSEKTQEATAVISDVEEIGANVAKARDRILRCRRALELGDHKSALNHIEDSIRAAEEARRRHAETMEGIKGLQAMAREAAELGLDVSRARRALAEVDEAIDEGLYAGANRMIQEAQAEMEKGYLKYAEDALARTGAGLRKAREMGAEVGAEERLLAETKGTFAQGRFQQVLKSCKECQRRLDERINEHIAEVILHAENLIKEAGKMGVDAKEFLETLERSEGVVGEGNYEQALRLATEALDKTKSLLRSSVSGTLSTLGGLLEESRRIGADVREVEEFIRLASASLQKDEFELAHDHALSGIAAVDRIREEFVMRRIQAVELKIRDAEDMGTVADDLRKSVDKVRDLLDRADFERASLLLQETEDNTIKRQARMAEEGIRKAEELLSKVKMDIDLSKARSLLEEARTALGSGDYEEALDYSSQSGEETNRCQRQFVEEVISATEESLAAATEVGADTKKAGELLEWARADRDAGSYDAALEKAVQSSEEAEQSQYDFVRGPIEYIRRVMKEAKVSDDRIRRLTASAEQFLEKKEYPEARREVLRAMDLTSEIQEKQALKEISAAEEVLAGVENSGAKSPIARNLLTSALKAVDAKDFEHAMKYAKECGVQAQKTKEEYQGAEKAVKAAEADTATLKELNLTPEDVADLLDLARTNYTSGDYLKSREYAAQARDKAERAYVKASGEALSSSQFKINYAKNIGADVSGAEEILRQAKAAHEAKDFRRTLELARRCREEAELAKERYKELVDTIYSAESKISVAHTYGLDTSAAERLLAMAVAQKSTSGEEALDFARQSMEEVQRALERYIPEIRVDIKLEGILQKEKWSQASLTISNAGKATAKDISVRFTGDLDIQGNERVPILRSGESRKQSVRVRPSKGGDLPLGMSLTCHREFDGKEFKSQETRWIRVEDVTPLATPLNQFVTKSVRCHICLGTIKSGLPLVRCECGKTYHETCASRVGECPNCGRDLRNQAQPEGG